MPYQNEFANKSSHLDIIRNPDVQNFLDGCQYLTIPSTEESEKLASAFQNAPDFQNATMPKYVMAVDGSRYESSIDDHLPSTKVGYVKIGAMLIDLSQYAGLREDNGRMVNPFKVAGLQKNNSALSFSLPSANVTLEGHSSVKDSFRIQLDKELSSQKTQFNPDDISTSLRSTLFELASLRPSRNGRSGGTGDKSKLRIFKCPTCEEQINQIVDDDDTPQYCKSCDNELYPSDCLRIWEEVSEYQSNVAAVSRVMMVAEHLMPIHYIRYLFYNSPKLLSQLAFFVDGPLAIYGTPAWLHASIMRFLHKVNTYLYHEGLHPLTIIGLQKSGQITDHIALIDKYIEPNTILPIDDTYRYQYIVPSREPSRGGFGSETYYGQDFIYKTKSGRVFSFALPYPFESKTESVEDFTHEKVDLKNYPQLERVLALRACLLKQI